MAQKIKKLLQDRVLIRPLTEDNKSPGGIIISAKIDAEKEGFGTVIMMSEMAVRELKVVKVGDTVIYGRMAGWDMEHDGEKCKMLRSTDLALIVGVVR